MYLQITSAVLSFPMDLFTPHQTPPTDGCRGTQVGFNPAWHSNLRPGLRTWNFGKAHVQHRMGRQCFRKGKVFNHPPKKIPPPHRKLTKRNLKNLKRMVFPNKESPDLEGFIFKIQCSFFGGRQLRFHTHPLTLCKMQFTKTFGFS